MILFAMPSLCRETVPGTVLSDRVNESAELSCL